MIERVKKAVAEASHMPFEKMICERIAIAAIEAMKEPTDAMLDAGSNGADYSIAYELMIEAALKDD